MNLSMNLSRIVHGLLVRTGLAALAAVCLVAYGSRTPLSAAEKTAEPAPRLVVRATPAIAFSPAEVSAQASLEGGSDSYEAYYCPSVEWNWGDGSTSEASADCQPYEQGKSEIERHYFVRHVYRDAGRYRVSFSLKRDGKKLASASAEVIVRPGLGGR